MNIALHVERGRAEFPDRIALRFDGRTISYAELDDHACAIAHRLQSKGVQQGDRVALYLPNCPEFVTAYLAALKLGTITVSLNPLWTTHEAEYALADSGSVVVICDRQRAALIPRSGLRHLRAVLNAEETPDWVGESSDRMVALAVEPETPAAIIYSSGTTGEPKGCTLSHGNVVSNMQAKVEYLEIQTSDRLLLFVPLSHCFGQNAILNAAFEAGATVVLATSFSAERVKEVVRREMVTMFFGPPTAYALLIDQARATDFSSVRYFFSAGAPMPPALALRWREIFGRQIHEGYGLTETSPFATYNHRSAYRPGTVGQPIRDVQIKIVDPEAGWDLGVNQVGEVAVRGPNVMLGYWEKPQATADVLRSGWLLTGDLGRLDEDGYLSLVGRLKEMISVGGLKVYPAEVEAALRRHPAVIAAAVVGMPDPILGEKVAAAVVLRPDHVATVQELTRICREGLANYKVPERVMFFERLPISPNGKVIRRQLAQSIASA
jgi:long-chain acyl-CoA synthetase